MICSDYCEEFCLNLSYLCLDGEMGRWMQAGAFFGDNRLRNKDYIWLYL